MFSYHLPNGGFMTKTYVTPEGKIKFDPPVYEQRYTAAIRIIEDPCWKQPLKKVVDFGCAELRLLPLLRRIPCIEHILEVDIDTELLKRYQQKAVPLISDHLQKRNKPLRIEVLQGSITDAVEQLQEVDVVIALEMLVFTNTVLIMQSVCYLSASFLLWEFVWRKDSCIEHLYADVLEKVPENIFGFMQPKLAIFSTPNSEFNVLFGAMLENGFRHLDHKFEWTRDEFKSWANNICETYQNYSVSFIGVGKAPPDHKRLGFATQIAIFARNDMIEKPLKHELIKKPINPDANYEVIYAVDFPYNKDERSKEQKILDEALYYVNQSKSLSSLYFNRERSIYQIPWKNLMDFTTSVGGTENDLLEVLEINNIKVEGDFIVVPEYEDDDYNDELDYDGEYNLEAQPYKYNLDDEEEEQLSSNLASGCNINASSNVDTEEDWD